MAPMLHPDFKEKPISLPCQALNKQLGIPFHAMLRRQRSDVLFNRPKDGAVKYIEERICY